MKGVISQEHYDRMCEIVVRNPHGMIECNSREEMDFIYDVVKNMKWAVIK